MESKTPLTNEQIEEMRFNILRQYELTSPSLYPGYVAKINALCDMALALSAARRDAERYRWLRSEEACTNPLYYAFWREFEAKLCREKQMDAAIDEAMKLDTHKHPDCEDRCQILEHKGYHTCSQTGRCEIFEAAKGGK